MLDDRSYMRSQGYRAPMSLTVKILIVNAVIYVLEEIGFASGGTGSWIDWFALSRDGLSSGRVWQLLTFQFMHSHENLFHILFNSWAIYVFGKAVEEAIGPREFLKLYLCSGVFGGLLQIGFGLMLGSNGGGGIIGASAGAFGLVAAYASMFPDRVLTLLLFFVLPIRLSARTLLIISFGLAALGMLKGWRSDDGIAHAAHMGGIFCGLGYIHWIIRGRRSFEIERLFTDPWRLLKRLVGKRSSRVKVNKTSSGGSSYEDMPSEEFISRQVDPILEKISTQGIHSLTDRERRILDKARSKITKK